MLCILGFCCRKHYSNLALLAIFFFETLWKNEMKIQEFYHSSKGWVRKKNCLYTFYIHSDGILKAQSTWNAVKIYQS